MKLGSMDRPGTGIRLWVKAGFASSSDPDWGGNRMCSALARCLVGVKKSLMALRFLRGGSMFQFRRMGFVYFCLAKILMCCPLHFQFPGRAKSPTTLAVKTVYSPGYDCYGFDPICR